MPFIPVSIMTRTEYVYFYQFIFFLQEMMQKTLLYVAQIGSFIKGLWGAIPIWTNMVSPVFAKLAVFIAIAALSVVVAKVTWRLIRALQIQTWPHKIVSVFTRVGKTIGTFLFRISTFTPKKGVGAQSTEGLSSEAAAPTEQLAPTSSSGSVIFWSVWSHLRPAPSLTASEKLAREREKMKILFSDVQAESQAWRTIVGILNVWQDSERGLAYYHNIQDMIAMQDTWNAHVSAQKTVIAEVDAKGIWTAQRAAQSMRTAQSAAQSMWAWSAPVGPQVDKWAQRAPKLLKNLSATIEKTRSNQSKAVKEIAQALYKAAHSAHNMGILCEEYAHVFNESPASMSPQCSSLAAGTMDLLPTVTVDPLPTVTVESCNAGIQLTVDIAIKICNDMAASEKKKYPGSDLYAPWVAAAHALNDSSQTQTVTQWAQKIATYQKQCAADDLSQDRYIDMLICVINVQEAFKEALKECKLSTGTSQSPAP